MVTSQNRRFRRKLDDVAGRIQAIHFGHLEINHNQVRLRLPEPLDCLLTVTGLITNKPISVMIQ